MDDIAFTPNIDSLMKKGISFKNAYAQQGKFKYIYIKVLKNLKN